MPFGNRFRGKKSLCHTYLPFLAVTMKNAPPAAERSIWKHPHLAIQTAGFGTLQKMQVAVAS